MKQKNALRPSRRFGLAVARSLFLLILSALFVVFGPSSSPATAQSAEFPEPAEPAQPAQPAQPAEPAQSAQPVQSAQPAKPIVTNTVGLTFVSIPAGRFSMGADPGFQGDGEYEKPAHQVIISKPFWLSRSEVTQAQWSAVMGTRPSVRKGANLPVDDVSWEDAQKFIEILAEREGRKYRLPTEAEWEYAARAGTETAYFFGDDPKSMSEYAHCGRDFAGSSPAPVMDKAPNAFGLFDMAGNLSEWVSDWFSEDYYAKSPRTNPKGPAGGSEKVHRGGAYASDPKACQSAWRNSDLPFVRSMTIGFRLAYDE